MEQPRIILFFSTKQSKVYISQRLNITDLVSVVTCTAYLMRKSGIDCLVQFSLLHLFKLLCCSIVKKKYQEKQVIDHEDKFGFLDLKKISLIELLPATQKFWPYLSNPFWDYMYTHNSH